MIIAWLLMAASGGALACSCWRSEGGEAEQVKSAYNDAAAVVLARAESVSEERVKRAYLPDNEEIYPGELTHFSEIRSWKGSHGKQFYTRIITACCMCGISFVAGETYLLYLYGPDKEGFYSTSICSRTSGALNVEDSELRLLDQLAAEAAEEV